MKKLLILSSIILIAGLSTNLFAQKDRTLSKGFSVNLIVRIPSDTYGLTSNGKIDGNPVNDQYKFSSIFGIQIGNRWYFKPKDNYGFGIMVNWVDISFAGKSGTESSADWGRVALDLSFLEVGPVGTFVLADNLALDAYYNLRPTVFSNAFVWSYSSSSEADEAYVYAGVGISHAIGAALRYKIFNFGMEYVLGGIDSEGTYSSSSNDVTLKSQKNMTNCFRIKLGLKF